MFKRKIITSIIVLSAFAASFGQSMDEGKNFLRNESYQKALHSFKSFAMQNKADGWYYLGETYFRINNLDSAKISYQKGIEADKEYGLNYAGLAKVMLRQNNVSEADKNIAAALEIADEKNVEVLQAVAEAYINGGKDHALKAKEILDMAIKLTVKKKDKRNYLLMGDMYMTQNDGSAAVENFKKAVDIDSSAIALVNIGKIFNYIKNYGEAELSFNHAIRVDPNYSVAYKEMGELKYSLKQYDQAIQNYEKYIQLSENSIENEKRIINFVYVSKDYKRAVDMINIALKDDPNNSYLLHLQAYSYTLLDDYQNGIPTFDRFFQNAKKEEIVIADFEYYSKLLSASGQDSLAILQLEKAAEMDTSRGDIYGTVAVLYFNAKKWDKVAESLTKKKERTGNLTPKEYVDLGRVYQFMQKLELADTTFALLIIEKPDLPYGYLLRGRTNAMMDPDTELGLGKPYYEQFLTLIQNDSSKYKKEMIEVHSYLGYYHYLQYEKTKSSDNCSKMKANWQKVIELDPENQQAKDALAFKCK